MLTSCNVNSDELPEGVTILSTQVAGHLYDPQKNKIGCLRKNNGRVLKPFTKEHLGKRENEFYENMKLSNDPIDVEIRRFMPSYYGIKELKVFGKCTKYIELGDICKGMEEPCLMDLKVGTRTWDPMATPEKKASEMTKYAKSKQAYGFCIPGFQVYNLSTGILHKYDKQYGYKLDAKNLVEALKIFLQVNKENNSHKRLIICFLSILWEIASVFRHQRKYNFYSSSLLFAYDAKHLRCILNNSKSCPNEFITNVNLRKLNYLEEKYFQQIQIILNKRKKSKSMVSQQNSTKSFSIKNIINKSNSFSDNKMFNLHTEHLKKYLRVEKNVSKSTNFQRLFRIHSFDSLSNNYKKKREDLNIFLDELNATRIAENNWAKIFMIDFAHVYPSNSNKLDLNYLRGIDNLIQILEDLLD